MFASNTYVIRLATDQDAGALRRLAELDSRAPLVGRTLIGELDGAPAAALALDDGRVIADPTRHTANLVVCLRVRAQALNAYQRTPSLRERLLAGVAGRHRRRSAPASATA
jgi:hypothetical protein